MIKHITFIIALLFMFSCGQAQTDPTPASTANCPLQIGTSIPGDVKVTNQEGEGVALQTIIDETPTILLFYRGGW